MEYDEETGYPIDDFEWSKDTSRPKMREDGKVTAELLWVTQCHSGDYHANMNIEMFIKWGQEKLVPTFEQIYTGEKMVLVTDNAPYYHTQEIGSLATLKSKILWRRWSSIK